MTSISPEQIDINDFDYSLPEGLIAQFPLKERDQSKLLVYKDNQIAHDQFFNIKAHLPTNSTIIFNETKVIPARLYFKRETGAIIEVFLLDPHGNAPIEQLLTSKSGSATWNCLVGNSKKWKAGETIQLQTETDVQLFSAERRNGNPNVVTIRWREGIPFSDLLSQAGQMPLPPYIRRKAETNDEEAYQTVYARENGAVAAPTAGLHFTDKLLESLQASGHEIAKLTLHVGAGTFKPVDVTNPWNHPMHGEHFQVNLKTLEKMANAPSLIATGTTSLRTLESLYWSAYKLVNGHRDFQTIEQHLPYSAYWDLHYSDALQIIIEHLHQNNLNIFKGYSSIMIMPGYRIRSIDALITNFHLPKSTLLLLIAAMVGDQWKLIYENAMKENYRFLSYGDSSLLFKSTVQ